METTFDKLNHADPQDLWAGKTEIFCKAFDAQRDGKALALNMTQADAATLGQLMAEDTKRTYHGASFLFLPTQSMENLLRKGYIQEATDDHYRINWQLIDVTCSKWYTRQARRRARS